MDVYGEGAYGEGYYSAEDSLDNTAISSWSFTIDGHPFVFFRLGVQGTLVFDMTTGQWHFWGRESVIGLGFKDGQSFNEFCLMGGSDDGSIYSFDPNEVDDYDGEFEAVVTGGLNARGRDTINCFGVTLGANTTGEEGREVSLYSSDDNGETWQLHGTFSPTEDAEDMTWRSLGLIRKPGRLFQIVDNGALASIDTLRMDQ